MYSDYLAHEAAKLADRLAAMNKRPERPRVSHDRRTTDNKRKDEK